MSGRYTSNGAKALLMTLQRTLLMTRYTSNGAKALLMTLLRTLLVTLLVDATVDGTHSEGWSSP